MSFLKGIDSILDRLERESPDPSHYYARLTDTAPYVAGYMLDSDTDMLSEKEQDYLLFLGMIVTTIPGKRLSAGRRGSRTPREE